VIQVQKTLPMIKQGLSTSIATLIAPSGTISTRLVAYATLTNVYFYLIATNNLERPNPRLFQRKFDKSDRDRVIFGDWCGVSGQLTSSSFKKTTSQVLNSPKTNLTEPAIPTYNWK
jgi:hypothetical protein